MKKILFVILISGFLGLAGKTQEKLNSHGKITGTVIDGSQKTVESATIALLRAKDSSTVKFSVANKDGQFAFENIPDGKFLVLVTAVGHQKVYSDQFELSAANQQVQLKTLDLVPVDKSMGNITITAKRPFIEQKIDKTVINVEASVTNAGATALEVLEKSPGVTVDKDGNISLKGKQGVTIMMDGRPTYLSGAELVNYLKSLPASALDQIEIMTNPPAKYDASGNSGIINIKVKKNKVKGFNGNIGLNYGQGVYWKINDNFNVNYRNDKVNLFASGYYNKGLNYQELDINRKFIDGNTKAVTAIFDQVSIMRNTNVNRSLKIGADYYASKNTTLGIVLSGFSNPSSFISNSTSYLKDAAGKVDSIVYAVSNNPGTWKNGSVNLNFRHQFDSAGTELTSDLDYLTYSSNGSQTFDNITYNTNWQMIHDQNLRSSLPSDINIYSAKVDFSRPFKSGLKFEAGLKSSYVKTLSSAFYYNVYNTLESPDYTKTNQFLYKENINAAYINFSKQIKKVGVQLGLRLENTNYSGNQFGNPLNRDSSFSKSYVNLFPTAYLSYSADKNNQFGLSFGRRINRPAYQNLNPFLFFLDEYTYQSGNPFIRPQFTNNIELTHIFKNFLTTTINYNHTIDYMMETFSQEKASATSNGYATVVRKGNIGVVDGGGISVNAAIPVAKWWNANLYTNVNYNKFSGVLNGENLNIEATNVLFNINNQFKFKNDWSAELSGFYRTKGVEGQILIQPIGQMNAGIGKQIWKGKGSLRFNVRDVLKTNHADGNINFQTTQAHFVNLRDSRVATLSFTWRFGKPIKAPQPKRKIGGADDEQSRVKTGN